MNVRTYAGAKVITAQSTFLKTPGLWGGLRADGADGHEQQVQASEKCGKRSVSWSGGGPKGVRTAVFAKAEVGDRL